MNLPPKIQPVDGYWGTRKMWPVNGTHLTEREMEVLRLVVAGFANKQIVDKLHVSIKTVEKHRQKCNEKLNVQSAVAMARVALKSGLVSLEEFLGGTEGENCSHGACVMTQAQLDAQPAWFVK